MNGSDNAMMLVRFNHKFGQRATEWLFAVFLLGWSATLFAYPSMFDGPAAVQFVGLKHTFAQPVWAFGCGFMAVARLIALYINGARRSTPFVRMGMAFVSCFFWYQIALGLFLSGVPTTGWAMYPAILLFEMYNTFRAASDARLVFDEHVAARDGTSGN